MKKDFVQVLNPRVNRYLKIDRAAGTIFGCKKSPGPYKNVPIVKAGKRGHGKAQ